MFDAVSDRLWAVREYGLAPRARAVCSIALVALLASVLALCAVQRADAYAFVYTYYNPDSPSQTIVIRGNVSNAGGVTVSGVTSGQQYVKDIRGTGDKSNLKDEYRNWVLDETKTVVSGATGSTTTTTDQQTGETTTETSGSGGWLDGIVNGWADSLFEAAQTSLQGITVNNFVVGPFNDLLGSQTFQTVQQAFSTVARVVGYSVLAIVFLVQLVRISNKLDGNQAVPGLKEVIFLLIMFVVLKFVLDNAFELCEAVYTAGNSIASALSPGHSVSMPDMTDTLSGQGSFLRLLGGLVFVLFAWAFNIVAFFVGIARALQIYVMAVFSPIPLSLFGLEETKSWAMGFVKNFISVCLAGAIMIVIMVVWSSFVSSTEPSDVFAYLAALLVGMYALVKSGAWARDLLGG